jgi:hypothetical protein
LKRIFVLSILLCAGALSSLAQTKHHYVLQGRAYYDGTSQVYKLNITDDGSGNFTGENVSILPTGEVLIGPVKGRVDYERKLIFFKELFIKNLPKGKTNKDYCFFTITASFTTSGNTTIIAGVFTSKSPEGNKCEGGTIKLVGTANVEKIREQYQKEIKVKKLATAPKPIVKPEVKVMPKPKPKPIVVPPKPKPEIPKKIIETKKEEPPKPVVVVEVPRIIQKEIEKTPPTKPVIAEPKVEPIAPQGTWLSTDYESDILQLEVLDYDINDGDNVSVFLNGKVLADSIILSGKTVQLEVNMNKQGNGSGLDTISIRANNEGYYYPNSGMLLLHDGQELKRITVENDMGERTYLVLRKRKK